MGLDADLTSIIREIVQFLESLCELDLPSKLEHARNNLLERSKAKLSTIATSARGSASPEPYLDMNAGKGFLLFPRKKNRDVEIEEYVGVEEETERSKVSSHQDYYESFQEINTNGSENCNGTDQTRGKNKSNEKIQTEDELVEEKLADIYRTLTAAKTIDKAYKSGPLYQKIERKPFGFVRGNIRLCWIGLVGSHLLVHGSVDDKQPPEVCSIRGYSARPAPNSLSRDPERSKSAFEIFCPGNKTFKFIAKDPEDMEEWLKAINHTCAKTKDLRYEPEDKIEKEKAENCAIIEEKYQDVGTFVPATKIKDSPESSPRSLDKENLQTARDSLILSLTPPPILPVRSTPRRLPSLPSEQPPAASYEPLDNAYEEDDIYHKIEDFRENRQSYENVKKTKGTKKLMRRKENKKKSPEETYDDVIESKKSSKNVEDLGETYDDVSSNPKDPKVPDLKTNNLRQARKNLFANSENSSSKVEESCETYDDVFKSSSSSSSSSLKTISSNGKAKTVESKKIKSEETETEKKSAKPQKNGGKVDKTCEKCDKSSEKSPSKSPSKRSFLDRVRNRKDSPKKEEKKKENSSDTKSEKIDKFSMETKKSSVPEIASNAIVDLPTYDDVSELINDPTNLQTCLSNRVSVHVDEISTYNCPPPPRPIYSKPPSPVLVKPPKIVEDSSEIYDDIENYREQEKDTNLFPTKIETFRAKTIFQENSEHRRLANEKIEKKEKIEINSDNIYSIHEIPRVVPAAEHKIIEIPFECEHYQIPRGDSVQVQQISQPDDQMYDDIGIADFRARQKDQIAVSDDTNNCGVPVSPKKPAISTKKPWNRFGSGKKISHRQSSSAQTSSMRIKSTLDLDDCSFDHVLPVTDKPETAKLNKLQKLINKVETTLGKQPSTKSSPQL